MADSKASVMMVLLIVFVVLKLTANIAWSWLWVLTPLWAPLGLLLLAKLLRLPSTLLASRRQRRASMRQAGWYGDDREER